MKDVNAVIGHEAGCTHTHEQIRRALDFADDLLRSAQAGRPCTPSRIAEGIRYVDVARQACGLYDEDPA